MIITELLTALTLGQIVGGANNPNKRLDTLWRKPYGRVLNAAGLTGTAGAAADGGVDLLDETNSLYKMFNINATKTIDADLITPLQAYIAGKHKFGIECIDAFSNTAYIMLSFVEQRPGEQLVGKIKTAEITLFENLGTMTANEGLGMEKTKNLSVHAVDETNDRWLSAVTTLGGGALGDSQLEFTVDGEFRGTLHDIISTTKVLQRTSFLPANIYIPAGSVFDIACIDAMAAEQYIGLKICKLVDSPNAAAVEAAKPQPV